MPIVPHILTRLDVIPISDNKDEVRLIATVRNELPRLPFFFAYYRKLGVKRFFFTDNNSDDGTTAYLLQQPDCHVFHTTNSYREAQYGVHWQNRLLDSYGAGHWCLIVDADELFVYPFCEKVSLNSLCLYLDRFGWEGVYTFMLDMYHPSNMAEAVCEPGKSFIDICPMFDRDYHFVRRSFFDLLRLPHRPPPFPETEVIGGPRARIFYPEQNTTALWPRLKVRLLGRLLKKFSGLGLFGEDKVPHMASMLFKVPLVKWRKGMAYYSSTHILTPIKLADITGVLLHFKFFSDFHDKAMLESRRGEHVGGARQYRRYADILQQQGGKASLGYQGSVRYRSSDDLMQHKLMHASTMYEKFVQDKSNEQSN
jgi:hypothetical protein